MSCLPDTTIVQNMCGCYPPDMCEVKGKDITGTKHFCRVCNITKISGICIGEMMLRAEAAGNEFSESTLKCRSCTVSTPVRMRRQQLEEGKQPLENMGAGVFSPACLLCGMGDGIELNVEGFCQDCLGVAPVKESYADEPSRVEEYEEQSSAVLPQSSVIPPHSGDEFVYRVGGRELIYTKIDASSFQHLSPGQRMSGRMAYYGCKFYRGNQPEVLYLRLDTYAYANRNGPRGDLIAFCALVPNDHSDKLSNVEISTYVLCSILVGTCGKRFLVVFNCTKRTFEDWTQLRKHNGLVQVNYRCDRSVEFNFDEVLAAWTEERSARLFSYDRYKRAYNVVKLLSDDDAEEEPALSTSSAADALTKESEFVAGAGEKDRNSEDEMPAPTRKVTSAGRKPGLRQAIKQVDHFSPGAAEAQEKAARTKVSAGKSKSKKRQFVEAIEASSADTDFESASATSEVSSYLASERAKYDPLVKNLGRNFRSVSSTNDRSSEFSELSARMDVMMHEIKQLKREDDNERVVRPRQAPVQGQSIDPLEAVTGSFGLVANVMNSMKGLRNVFKDESPPSRSVHEQQAPAPNPGSLAAHNQDSSSVSNLTEELLKQTKQNQVLLQALIGRSNTTPPPMQGIGEPTGTAALQQAVMMLQQQQQDNRSGSAHLHSHLNPSASTLLPQASFQYPSLLTPYSTQVQYPLQNSNLFQNIGQFPQLSPNSGNSPWDVLRALFSNHRG